VAESAGGRRELGLGLALSLLAIGYAWLAFRLPVRALKEVVGPDFFPKLLAGLLILLALPLLVRGLSRRSDRVETEPIDRWARAGLVIALMLVYVWALPRLGFLLATVIYLGVMIRLAGTRRWRAIVGAALAITALIFLSFATLFAVPLPRGLLF